MQPDLQYRGHCQTCGEERSVRHGRIVHHEFSTENGAISGRCSGTGGPPVEADTRCLQQRRRQLVDLTGCLSEELRDLVRGTRLPEFIQREMKRRPPIRILFANLPEADRKEWISNRCDALRLQLADLESAIKLLDDAVAFAGEPLASVPMPKRPPAILVGEQRIRNGQILTATSGTTKYLIKYSDQDGIPGEIGANGWRKLEFAQ